jgi:DNA-binding MarR family transcriptional regulator
MALGARLRRLSERIDREADRIYRESGIRFEQRWYGVMNQLAAHGPMTVGALAGALGITHAAVSQTRASLVAEGLVDVVGDPADARRRMLSLSVAGERLLIELQPLWRALNDVAADLSSEAPGLLNALDKLEAALARQSLEHRVRARLTMRPMR